jgi:hypothetical protein
MAAARLFLVVAWVALFRLAPFPTWKRLGFLAHAPHLADEAILKRFTLLETATRKHALIP